MKRILILCLFAILFSSFFSGNYFTNHRDESILQHEAIFPHIIQSETRVNTVYPPNLMPNPAGDAASNKGTFRTWMENGKGNFSTTITESPVLTNSDLGAKYDPLMFASILYENPRRPSGTSANISNSIPSTEPNRSSLLLPGRQIKLFQNVPRVVSGDPMTFAISYKLPPVRETNYLYRIVLKYNHSGSRVAPVFIPLQSASDSIDLPVIEKLSETNYSLNSNNIPAVRTFSTETITYHTSSNYIIEEAGLNASALTDAEITRERQEDTWNNNLSFENAVLFNTLTKDTAVHNIFVTLNPGIFDKQLINEQPPVFLEAVLQKTILKDNLEQEKTDKSGNIWTDVETSRIEDELADAHDPNEVIVFPKCIKLPQRKTTLHYQVNFQNTGEGDANGIVVRFHAPKQADMNSISIKSVSCGGATASGTAIGTMLSSRHYTTPENTIIFKVTGTLKGAYVDNPAFNPETKGSIIFDLDINPETDIQKTTTIDAFADIFFRSAPGNTTNDIKPTMTERNRYPAEVDGYELPIITNTEQAVYRENCGQKCNCQKPGCWLFTWWGMLLLLLLLILLIFAVRCFLRRSS
jgi:hypothetical protein